MAINDMTYHRTYDPKNVKHRYCTRLRPLALTLKWRSLFRCGTITFVAAADCCCMLLRQGCARTAAKWSWPIIRRWCVTGQQHARAWRNGWPSPLPADYPLFQWCGCEKNVHTMSWVEYRSKGLITTTAVDRSHQHGGGQGLLSSSYLLYIMCQAFSRTQQFRVRWRLPLGKKAWRSSRAYLSESRSTCKLVSR